jgi:hypothetical protein
MLGQAITNHPRANSIRIEALTTHSEFILH